MNYVGIDWAYGRAAWCAMGESGHDRRRRDDPGRRGRARPPGPGARHRGRGLRRDDERRGLGQRSAAAGRLAGEGRPRPQGQRRRPARLQDRQGRRQGAGRALPPRPGPRALGALGRGPRPARAPRRRRRTWSRPAPRLATGSSACSPSSACGSPMRGSESPTRSSCSSAAGCRRSGEPRSPSCSS